MQNRLLLGGIAAFAAVAASAAGGAPAQQRVTLQMERYYDDACRCMKTRFFGVIASGAPNQYVAVLGKRCGYRHSTQVAGASTSEGGAWSVEANPVLLTSSTNFFRARWNGHLSEPLVFRQPVTAFPFKETRRRFTVQVASDKDLRGRFVELQRLEGGSWTRLRRKRLVRSTRVNSNYNATFRIRQRGLRLRFFVPEETVAPCYSAGATKSFSS
jgi:hypothetical protein